MSIVVVTSNSDLAEMMEASLPLRGVSVRVASSHVMAESMERENSPAAIVFDIEQASHWFACAHLAARVRSPIVALTGWIARDGRFRQRAFEVGCAAFVAKPCAPDDLLDVIERVSAGERGIEIIRC